MCYTDLSDMFGRDFMKKTISLLVCLIMVLGLFSGCKGEKKSVRIIAMGDMNTASLVHLMKNSAEGETRLNYTVNTSNTSQSVIARLGTETEIAVVPASMASTLYTKMRGQITVLATTYSGEVSLIESGNEIKKISDLKDKVIHFSSRNTAGEYILRYLLKKNGVKDGQVSFKYSSDETEFLKDLTEGNIDVCVATQGVKAKALAKNKNLRSVMNLRSDWNFVTEDAGYIEGCVLVTNEFLENNKSTVKKLLKDIEKSVDIVKTHIDDTAKLCVEYKVFEDIETAKTVLKSADFSFVDGKKMKKAIKKNLNALHKAGMVSLGQKAPGDSFYYK